MVKFIQSATDFPLDVVLGKKEPYFDLHRWQGDKGLRFVPFDEEGFSLRGDKRRLVYKGRRRSHRFTILGDGAFEYDCILNREPESNVVTLQMEGAENFDFFRQPDFVPDPFLKGSYAVYKKETFIGEGTGKLCHIHRPQIIDAGGRKCWGDLSVTGNELRITIPQEWLASAKYPVVVDPVIGTTTTGSQTIWDEQALLFEIQIPVNRFLVTQPVNGLCTAHFYTNQNDHEAFGRPVLYSDNFDIPLDKRSINEQLIDLRVISGRHAGWRSGNFNTNTNITAGSHIWFGMFCEYFWYPRFDFGAKCYSEWHGNDFGRIPDFYPIRSPNFFYNFRLSVYFTYSLAQNYVRTLTQGVRLSDTRRLAGNYKRTTPQITGLADTNKLTANYKRDISQIVINNTMPKVFFTFLRQCLMTVGSSTAETERRGNFYRTHKDTVQAQGFSLRHLFVFIKLASTSFVRDFVIRRFFITRKELVLKSRVTRELTLESRIN
ncbi:MAG: hypothetical protein FWC97_03220 [Treponema sp.]|nr:hypothetical protein [Treponema sp.]